MCVHIYIYIYIHTYIHIRKAGRRRPASRGLAPTPGAASASTILLVVVIVIIQSWYLVITHSSNNIYVFRTQAVCTGSFRCAYE